MRRNPRTATIIQAAVIEEITKYATTAYIRARARSSGVNVDASLDPVQAERWLGDEPMDNQHQPVLLGDGERSETGNNTRRPWHGRLDHELSVDLEADQRGGLLSS
jgi:hypothetical protein